MAKDKKSKEVKPEVKSKETASKMKKANVFENIKKFFRDCKNEVKKIVWPTPKTVFKNMGIVLAVIFAVGLFIFGLDTALITLLGKFMSVAG